MRSSDPRQEFLQKQWRPYPCVPKPILSVAQFMAAESQVRIGPLWIGGCLESFDENSLTLGSQGAKVSLAWSGARMLTKSGEFVEPCRILRPGDKLALRLQAELSGSLPTGEEVLLLSPCEAYSPRPTFSADMAKKWSGFLREVGLFFEARGFLRVETPHLVICPGVEPHLEPFSTEMVIGSRRKTLFLPTSPELHLKKLLAEGFSEIFEITPCFRNGEISEHHQPEFTMLEWYRAYSDLEAILGDLKDLLIRLKHQGLVEGDLGEPTVMSVGELFKTILKFDLSPTTSKEELQGAVQKLRPLEPLRKDEGWDDLFHRLWIDAIDPWLSRAEEPVIVTQYPASQAALSRVVDAWADRAELYWRGFEIANGFHELNDPVEQRRRFVRDQGLREQLGRASVPIDEEFMSALQQGLPPSGGMALGLERLFMACQKIQKISEVKAFTHM